MAMEGVLRSSLAALLLLTLVVLATSATGGGDDTAAAVEKAEKQCHHRPSSAGRRRAIHALVTFKNKDGEELRLLADRGSATLDPWGFANRSGHWFYNRRRARGGLPKPSNTRTDAEGFWNTLGELANATAAGGDPDPDPAADVDDEEQAYMLVGMQTSGGDKIRVVVVAGQRYFSITGNAKGWFLPPKWFFRDDGERHRLLTSVGGNGSSHEEFVASNVLAVMMKAGKACMMRLAC